MMKLLKHTLHRIALTRKRNSLLKRLPSAKLPVATLQSAMEYRLQSLLNILSNQPNGFEVIEHQQLDSANDRHGTWKIRLRSQEPVQIVPKPTDIVYIQWENRRTTVENVLNLLGNSGSEPVWIQPASSIFSIQKPLTTTLSNTLVKNVEIETASPEILEWAGLTEAANHNRREDRIHDRYHKNFLKTLDWTLPHPEYKPKQYDLISVLQHGLNQQKEPITKERFLKFQGRLHGRSYTLSSFNHGKNQLLEIEITVSQVYRQMISGNGNSIIQPSRASHYLLSRKVGDIVMGWIFPDVYTFQEPENPQKPTLVICTGSGVSALLSLLRTRTETFPIWFFYGIRSWSKKSLYGKELLEYCTNGKILKMDVAESRPEDDSIPKRHVQDLLWEYRKEVSEYLKNDGRVYVCGGLAMGEQVRTTFQNILIDQGMVGSQEEARKTIDTWEQTLRFQMSVSGVS